MKRIKTLRLLFSCSLPLLATAGLQAAEAAEERQDFLRAYCMGCHNGEDFSGGLAFDLMPVDAVAGNADIWEKVRTKAGVGMMPPPGEKQPGHEQLQRFLRALE